MPSTDKRLQRKIQDTYDDIEEARHQDQRSLPDLYLKLAGLLELDKKKEIAEEVTNIIKYLLFETRELDNGVRQGITTLAYYIKVLTK